MTTNSDAVEAALHDLEGSDFAAIRNHAATLRSALSQPDTSEGVEGIRAGLGPKFKHLADDVAVEHEKDLKAARAQPDTTHNAELVEDLEKLAGKDARTKAGYVPIHHTTLAKITTALRTPDSDLLREALYALKSAKSFIMDKEGTQNTHRNQTITALEEALKASQNGQADTLTQGGEA